MLLSVSIALVTDANRGLGACLVDELVALDCKIYASARNFSDLDELVSKHGDMVVPIELDVTNVSAIEDATRIAKDRSLLINNAGRLYQRSIGEAGDL